VYQIGGRQLGRQLLLLEYGRVSFDRLYRRAVNANLAIAALQSLTLISVSALTSPMSASVSAPR